MRERGRVQGLHLETSTRAQAWFDSSHESTGQPFVHSLGASAGYRTEAPTNERPTKGKTEPGLRQRVRHGAHGIDSRMSLSSIRRTVIGLYAALGDCYAAGRARYGSGRLLARYRLTDATAEGLYVRKETDAVLVSRAKLVRAEFLPYTACGNSRRRTPRMACFGGRRCQGQVVKEEGTDRFSSICSTLLTGRLLVTRES